MISGLNEFRILDLFCGAGGLSWGMHKNPYFKTMVALDFDEKAVATFKNNMPGSEVLVGDITDATVKEKVVSLSRKKCVNMIVGGPPCQGYSMKGKKLGLDDPRNFLFREYLDLVEKLQPDVFVIENVKGLLLSANGWFKDEIVKAVELKRADRIVTTSEMIKQVKKYHDALNKVLSAIYQTNYSFEILFVLGRPIDNNDSIENRELVANILKPMNARVVYYQELIENAYKAYNEYIAANKQSQPLIDMFSQLESSMDD